MQQQIWTMKIRPHEKLWHIDFKEIWHYRDLIELFVRRNIVVQYKQTILGPLWYLIQPILALVSDTTHFDRHHEYGGVWRHCQDEHGRDATGNILYGW